MAERVVSQELGWVGARWEVTGEFVEARALALLRRPPQGAEEATEYAQAGAGLAAGYVELGLHGAALITAALALEWGATAVDSLHAGAVEVLFSEALLTSKGRQLVVEEFGWPSASRLTND